MARTPRVHRPEDPDGRDVDQYNQVFVKDGQRIKFFFYTLEDGKQSEITLESAEALGQKVRRHGGTVTNVEAECDVVIVKDEDAAAEYSMRYSGYQNKIYVEPTGFIARCIRMRVYQHVAAPRQGMPGRPGRKDPTARVAFSSEDDNHLVEYLAHVLPDREQGGRSGNSVYQRLVARGENQDWEEWKWVKRHTWHSWRERYKKNKGEFDQRIEDYLEINPPPADLKGVDHRDRRRGRGGRGIVQQFAGGGEVDEEEDDYAMGDYGDFERGPNADRDPRQNPEEEEEEEEDGLVSDLERGRKGHEDEQIEEEAHSVQFDLEDDAVDFEEGGFEKNGFEEDDFEQQRSLSPEIEFSNTQQTLVGSQVAKTKSQPRIPLPSQLPSSAPVLSQRPRLIKRPRPRPSSTRDDLPASSQAILAGSSGTQLEPAVRDDQPEEDAQADAREVQKAAIPPRPKPKPKRKRIDVVGPPPGLTIEDPPYRNTRARSRSKEPTTAPVSKKAKVDKGKQRATDMDAVPETSPEEEHYSPNPSNVHPVESHGSNENDEEDVNHILEADDGEPDPFVAQSREELQVERSAQNEDVLSTDDENTSRALFVAKGVLSASISRLAASRANVPSQSRSRPERSSRASSVALQSSTHFLPVTSAKTIPQRESFYMPPESYAPAAAMSAVPVFNMPSSSTYASQAPGAAVSAATSYQMDPPSSPESSFPSDPPDIIPLSGTRADAEKQRRVKEQWDADYSPLPGTKAAQYLSMSQRRPSLP
ncbi:hypothetical protein EIP91_002600 [Steccherinum ochraceum]|uniref:TERF2-interacting telomeric protein 1 Myb domain-containing protein n=1 Tax=Steccherinum ochraceum TaxID=92696 RepID=A0A4R0RP23_9APHY|nr:hypothetical protein EIP91_002600 [Steccherinum ochraceum]